jgi:quercetin dioxygenase-like cupin family protein
MTAPSSKFLDTSAMEWRAFDEAPGVTFRVLKTHRPGTGVTLMLRFTAGAAYPAHRHPEGEEYYVLDGELQDGARSYGAGTYVWHPPGSVHRPSSATGATVLIVLPAAIEIVAK